MERDGAEYLPHQPIDRIAHYYGDAVRQLLVFAAGLMLIGAPFYTDALAVELPFIIIGAIALVAVAALANPHNKAIFMVGAVAAGVGIVVYETWALNAYLNSAWIQFVARELIAIVFLAAFYFNMKTVRAFVMHQIGRRETTDEFEERPVQRSQSTRTWKDEFTPWFLRQKPTQSRPAAEHVPRATPGRSREEFIPKEHPYEEQL